MEVLKKFNSANEVYEDNKHYGIIDNNIKNTMAYSNLRIPIIRSNYRKYFFSHIFRIC